MLNAGANIVAKIPSSSSAPASSVLAGERRSSERVWTLMRIAKLSTTSGDDLGIVRNVSQHGMMIEVHPQLPIDGPLSVDFGDGRAIAVEVRWRKGATIGLHFTQAVAVETLLEKLPVDDKGRVARSPRVALRHPVKLYCAGQSLAGEICDVSVGGARIYMTTTLARGSQVNIDIPLIGTVAGVVRWSADGSNGISFNRPVPIHALMAWLATSSKNQQADTGDSAIVAFAPAMPGGIAAANMDALTKLANRQGFLEYLNALVAADGDGAEPFVLGFLDIDGFKRVNAQLGYQLGDECLIAISERLRRAVGDGNMVARLNGDEFAIILRGASSARQTEQLAASILADLRQPIALSTCLQQTSACMGLAAFPVAGESTAELMRNAHIALYAAKHAGRDSHACFEPDMLDKIDRRAKLRNSFAAGLLRDEFTIHFEPIIPLQGDELASLEVLFRWQHPDKGLQLAAAFQEIFAEDDLAAQVGQIVVTKVIRQIGEWRKAQIPFGSLWVNATLGDFRKPNFADLILDAIAQGAISKADIRVEITENVMLCESSEFARIEIERLHRAGVCVVFDDFGTGYASLRHLREMPICALKIDQSFIAGIATDGMDRAMVEKIIELAHVLGKKVVAEGVECAEQAAMLRAMGCDYAQGHLYSLAQPADHVPALLTSIATSPR